MYVLSVIVCVTACVYLCVYVRRTNSKFFGRIPSVGTAMRGSSASMGLSSKLAVMSSRDSDVSRVGEPPFEGVSGHTIGSAPPRRCTAPTSAALFSKSPHVGRCGTGENRVACTDGACGVSVSAVRRGGARTSAGAGESIWRMSVRRSCGRLSNTSSGGI